MTVARRQVKLVTLGMVELIALLSNPSKQEKWSELVEEAKEILAVADEEKPKDRQPRQAQYRLEKAEIAVLVKAYKAGGQVSELSSAFGIHRNTVRDILRREGVRPRQRGLSEEQVQVAAQLYANGESTMELGQQFNVHATTVWRAIKATGVQFRSEDFLKAH